MNLRKSAFGTSGSSDYEPLEVRDSDSNKKNENYECLVRDGLERAVLTLTELSCLAANASKVEIKNAIRTYNTELKKSKVQLTNMVPGRALAGFFIKDNEAVPWDSARRLTEYIRRIDRTVTCLPYTLGESSNLKKEVHFHSDWMQMIQDNTVNIHRYYPRPQMVRGNWCNLNGEWDFMFDDDRKGEHDGCFVGSHQGAYERFSFDITDP